MSKIDKCEKCDHELWRSETGVFCPVCPGKIRRDVSVNAVDVTGRDALKCERCKDTGELRCDNCDGEGECECWECGSLSRCDECSDGYVECPECEASEKQKGGNGIWQSRRAIESKEKLKRLQKASLSVSQEKKDSTSSS